MLHRHTASTRLCLLFSFIFRRFRDEDFFPQVCTINFDGPVNENNGPQSDEKEPTHGKKSEKPHFNLKFHTFFFCWFNTYSKARTHEHNMNQFSYESRLPTPNTTLIFIAEVQIILVVFPVGCDIRLTFQWGETGATVTIGGKSSNKLWCFRSTINTNGMDAKIWNFAFFQSLYLYFDLLSFNEEENNEWILFASYRCTQSNWRKINWVLK